MARAKSETAAEESAPKPKRKLTPKQREVLAAARKKRDENQAARRAAREAGEQVGPKARLQKLIDGELTVKDLDMKELRRGRFHDGNGSFSGGTSNMRIPPKIRDQMHSEYLRRVLDILKKGGATAANEMVKMMTDPDVDAAVRFRAQQAVLERVVGKVPDVVHVGAETEFDRLQQGVFEFDRSELGGDNEEEST